MSQKFNRKWFIPSLLLLIIIALLLRLEVSRELKNADLQVSKPSVYTDMYTYKLYSEQIVKGEYKRDFYYQPFYYAVFLPLIKQIAGFGIWPVIFTQTIISALTIWLSAMVSAMLWGRRSAIITAILLTFSSILMLYVPYHLIATLQAFWVVLTAFLALKCLAHEKKTSAGATSRSNLYWGMLGFVIGLGIVTRGNIWFFVPGIIGAALIARFKYYQASSSNWFKKVMPVMFLIAMIIIPQIPFAWKNTEITGKLSGPSTAAGAVLSLGNTPESPPGGRDAGMGPGPMEYPLTCRYWNAECEKVSVFKRMWQWFCREPMAFVELQWRKMLLFWDRREIPNNIAVEHQGMKSRTWQLVGLIPIDEKASPQGTVRFITMNIIPTSIILLVISMAGLFVLICKIIKRPKKAENISYWQALRLRISNHLGISLLLYFIIAYWLGTAGFYILARFRVPVLPLLAIIAGGYLQSLFLAWKIKKRLTGRIVALIIALLLVNFGYDYYRYIMEAGILQVVRPNGVVSPMGNELMVADNGPYSFGSWRPLELRQGIPVKKTFSIPNVPHGDNVRFMLEMVWEVPGKMILEVNGQKYQLKEDSPIRKLYEFRIKPNETKEITLVPYDMDCRVFVVLDYQRDYGRTEINGKKSNGELVSNLIFKK